MINEKLGIYVFERQLVYFKISPGFGGFFSVLEIIYLEISIGKKLFNLVISGEKLILMMRK